MSTHALNKGDHGDYQRLAGTDELRETGRDHQGLIETGNDRLCREKMAGTEARQRENGKHQRRRLEGD